MQRITKRVMGGLKASGNEQFLWDAKTRGYGVRASRDGRISYVVQYRFEGRQRRYRIGAHGSLWTPETTRIEARRLLGELAEAAIPSSAVR